MKDQIYDFLCSAGRPVSIGEIAARPQFKGCARREVASALQSLQSEGIAFRSLQDGKAYYSANPEEGVGRNPTQQFISDVAVNMNRAFNQAQEPESDAVNLFQALNQLQALFEEMAEEDEDEKEAHRFTYNKGIVADCELYTVAIPDGFKLEMGKDDRDFVAWLPRAGSDDEDEARIAIYAGTMNGGNMEGLADHLKSVEMSVELIRATQWTMRKQTERFLGPSEMADIPCVGEVGGSYMYNNNNYQMMVTFPDGVKQFRILINEVKPNREKYHDAVVDWVSRLHLKKPFPTRKSLDGDSYLPLTKKSLEQWLTHREQAVERLAAINNMQGNACMAEYEYNAEHGSESITLLKRRLREGAAKLIPTVEAMCEEGAALLARAYAQDANNSLLPKLKEAVFELLNNLEITITLEDEPLVVKSKRMDELRGKMEVATKPAAKKPAERKPEPVKAPERKPEATKPEPQKAEAAKPAADVETDAEYQARSRELTEAYNKEMAEAQRSYDNACAEHRNALAPLEREKQKLTALLPTYGPNQMTQKGQTRAKLANIEKQAAPHRAELSRLEQEFERKKAVLKDVLSKQLEQARQKAEQEAERKRPKAVKQTAAPQKPAAAPKDPCADAIVRFLRPGEQYTVQELMKLVPELQGKSVSYTMGLVRDMVDKGILYRKEENRKPYFGLKK